jgi:RNA polymerase sigma factor (TIGR02999 family)
LSDVTRILQSIDSGDAKAAEELLPLVYQELRRLAAVKMAQEAPGQTLQPTALVHEAWIRLVGQDREQFHDRRHFFHAAAEAMRRILVDNARRKRRQKRGGGQANLDIAEFEMPVEKDDEKILRVHDALDRFSAHDPVKAEIVKLRYYVGLTHQEIASLMGIAEKTVMRHWAYAKAWLADAIRKQERD